MNSDSPSQPASGRLFGLAVAVVLLFYLFNVGIYFDFTADDPGITFRYGANLFDGHGLVYNPGERVEGYSNFGYVILSGLVYKLLVLAGPGRDWMILAMKVLNLAAGAATGFLCYRFCRDELRRDRLTALLTVFLLATNGAFIVNVSSPLETTLCGTLVMAMMVALSRYLESPGGRGWGSWRVVAILGALLALWRIDSPVLVAAFGGALLLIRRFRLEKCDWLILGVWTLVFLSYTAFRLAWFGDFANNPYYTKVKWRMGLASPLDLDYITGFFRYLGGNVWVFLGVAGVVLLRAPRRYFLPAMIIICQWLYIAAVNGDWMPAFRFWAVIAPCFCIFLTGLLDIPLRRVSVPVARIVKIGLVCTVASYWFTHAQVCHRVIGQTPFRVYSTWREFSPRKLNPYWQTADWLNAHVDKSALMAIQEAGYIPFMTELAALDTFGLCNYELARMEGRRGRLGLKILWDPAEPGTRYILSRRPDVLVVGPCADSANAPERFLGTYLLAATPQDGMNVFRREDSRLVH